jgi:hypothetical protein
MLARCLMKFRCGSFDGELLVVGLLAEARLQPSPTHVVIPSSNSLDVGFPIRLQRMPQAFYLDDDNAKF